MTNGINLSAFFAGFATAYFLLQAHSLLARREPTRLHRLLGYIFLYWTFSNAKDIFQSFPGGYSRPVLDAILMADGWSAVTFACFLFELTMPGWVTLRRVALLCLPFAVFTVVYVAQPTSTVLTAYTIFLAHFGVLVLAVGYAKAEEYIGYVRRNYSNIEEIDISWIRYVYVVAFFSQLLWLLISLSRSPVVDAVYYLSSVVMWQLVVVHCRGLKPVVPEPETDAPLPAGDPQRVYTFAGVLEKIVEEEELYLNPTLSLSHLTARLGTNRTYLSDYFGRVKQITFYDYINGLRIRRKSLPMMKDHPEYTLDYIAEQSGFKSLSTFRRAFRKHTGQTPGRFREDGPASAG